MKKKLILIFFFMWSHGYAEPSKKSPNWSLAVQYNKKNHKYKIYHGKKNSLLVYQKGAAIKRKKIPQPMAKTLIRRSQKIIWQARYKTRVTQKKCHPYVHLIFQREKTTVCNKNHKILGRTFGYLNTLQQILK